MRKTAQTLYEAFCGMPVVDTHEHLENENKHAKWNVLSDYTQHYFSCDLISAGLSPDVIAQLADPAIPILEKWMRLEPYWEHCRHTGYGMMLDIAAQKLYGVPEINRDTIQAVEQGFQAFRAQEGFSARLLKQTCGIRCVIDNIWHLRGDSEGGLYRFVTQIDEWVMFNPAALDLPQDALLECGSIQRWVDLCLDTLEKDISLRGAFGLKCALAYQRSLSFERISVEEGNRGFELIRSGSKDADARLVKHAQDYVMREILRWANARGLLLQVHTGYQEGNQNLLANANPESLCELIPSHPDIRFDLFHMGFPYHSAMGAMGKMFPNVRVNLCWAHILSPVAARMALGEWLHLMPVNKIFGFGGDCLFFDGVVGHLELARQNIALVLGGEVDGGAMPLARALQIGRMLFHENPADFYRL